MEEFIQDNIKIIFPALIICCNLLVSIGLYSYAKLFERK